MIYKKKHCHIKDLKQKKVKKELIPDLIPGVAKSQNCILVYGQVVWIKHLFVPMHFLSVLLQIQMQVFKKNGLINKIII